MIILDTNVVSELMRSVPSHPVLTWLKAHPGRDVYTTAIAVAEIRYGIARLTNGRRRDMLHQAAAEVFAAFPDQVLSFDVAAAGAYADVVAHRDSLGKPINGFDAQIAAICRVHAARLATRNTRDFANTGVTTVDPWRADTR